MRIRFTKPLRIALDGIRVVSYKAGDVVDDPHRDVLVMRGYWAKVDEKKEPLILDSGNKKTT